MKKGEKMSEEQKRKIGLANSISLKGCIPWNKGLSAKEDKRVNSGEKIGTWVGGLPNCIDCNKKLARRYTKSSRCKKCYGYKSRGEIHHLWKGENCITLKNKRIRTSTLYKEWRKSVFERDDYTCVLCLMKGIYLQADHIKPFCNYPEFRFDIDNGRTLCIPCHKKTDTFGYKAVNK